MAGGTAALAACAPTEEPRRASATHLRDRVDRTTRRITGTAATCGHTDQVADKAAHEWTVESETETEIVYTCICGAYADARARLCRSWTYDETNHWHAAPAAMTPFPKWAAYTMASLTPTAAAPAPSAATCILRATPTPMADEWSYNDTNHWHEATCGHDLRADEGAHIPLKRSKTASRQLCLHRLRLCLFRIRPRSGAHLSERSVRRGLFGRRSRPCRRRRRLRHGRQQPGRPRRERRLLRQLRLCQRLHAHLRVRQRPRRRRRDRRAAHLHREPEPDGAFRRAVPRRSQRHRRRV